MSLQDKSPENQRLRDEIISLHRKLREDYKAKFNRSIPFADELFNRWEKAEFLGFGEGTRIYDTCYVFGNVTIGKECFIGQYCILDGSGGLEIDDHCHIAAGTHILTHDSVEQCLSAGKKPMVYAPVKIGDCCYIGPQSIIGKGVTLGHHSVVGAQSFVNKSIPPYSVVYGTPARVVGRIEISSEGVIKKILY